MHVTIETKNCGLFVVPLNEVTLHIVDGSCRVKVSGDPEWREIGDDQKNHVLNKIATMSRAQSSQE